MRFGGCAAHRSNVREIPAHVQELAGPDTLMPWVETLNALRTRAIGALALALGLFHLANVSGLLVLSTMVVRAFHLTVMLSLVFLLAADPAGPGRRKGGIWLSVSLFCAAMGTGVYLLARWEDIAFSGGATTATDIAVGVMIILLVVEAARRATGNFLALITAVFLAYPVVSPYLPGVLYGRGVRLDSAISFLSLSGQGIYGIPIGVASTYIILFTIFGAFLSEFGAGGFFFRFSTVLTRGMTAASAKTAVVFSTLLGMISGSAAGNVAVTGSFTIPVMKREGYRPHQAGAIEAVVSTGGQIMPPVMGAAAFIMAEIVGTPYANIMKAGLMPALLFFVSVLVVVHLQALKSGIRPGEPEADAGRMSKTLLSGVPFVVPFAALVGMMIAGYSPVKASFYAIDAADGVAPLVDEGISQWNSFGGWEGPSSPGSEAPYPFRPRARRRESSPGSCPSRAWDRSSRSSSFPCLEVSPRSACCSPWWRPSSSAWDCRPRRPT